MIVYVETNFLLELAYLQESHESCERLLALAAAERLQFVAPAFALLEARLTWDRKASERKVFLDELQRQITQLSRSDPFRGLPENSRELVSALVDSGEEVRRRLEATIETIARVSEIPEITYDDLAASREYEDRHDFRPPDAVIYASVIRHASGQADEKLFITRDHKGFADPDIRTELERHNVRLITDFVNGLRYIERTLAGNQ